MDLSYFNYFLQDEVGFCNDKLRVAFGDVRAPADELDQRHYDIAAAVQWVFEDTMEHCLETLYDLSGEKESVALAGGSLMNSVFNGKLEAVSKFDNSFISSCPDDSGVSIGAALAAQSIQDVTKSVHQVGGENYWGPAYSNDEIEDTFNRYKIPYEKVPNVEHRTAELLAKGGLVGWFQGPMEFGQRALGNRSILADPRQPNMKNVINAAVKYREAFRPFAPSVQEEFASDYFEMQGNQRVPFMERVFPIRHEYLARLPAVAHIDGSARLQTVSKKINLRYWRLIEEFGKLTGISVLLNTSFNVNGEPIVCSPSDAIRTFYSCGLDFLVLGDCIVSK